MHSKHYYCASDFSHEMLGFCTARHQWRNKNQVQYTSRFLVAVTHETDESSSRNSSFESYT